MEGAVFLLPFRNRGALTGCYFYVKTVGFNLKPQTPAGKEGCERRSRGSSLSQTLLKNRGDDPLLKVTALQMGTIFMSLWVYYFDIKIALRWIAMASGERGGSPPQLCYGTRRERLSTFFYIPISSSASHEGGGREGDRHEYSSNLKRGTSPFLLRQLSTPSGDGMENSTCDSLILIDVLRYWKYGVFICFIIFFGFRNYIFEETI